VIKQTNPGGCVLEVTYDVMGRLARRKAANDGKAASLGGSTVAMRFLLNSVVAATIFLPVFLLVVPIESALRGVQLEGEVAYPFGFALPTCRV
jgi:hypothetical protein